MRALFFVPTIALGCLLFPATAAAQLPPSPEILELRREIAQAKAMIDKWKADLAALEKRLALADAREAGTGFLRFPWDVERAMIGEGMQRSLRGGLPPQLEIQQQRGRWESTPRIAPRR